MDLQCTNWCKAFVMALLIAPAGVSAKDTGLAYVSSEKDHALTMVDLKTLNVVGTGRRALIVERGLTGAARGRCAATRCDSPPARFSDATPMGRRAADR